MQPKKKGKWTQYCNKFNKDLIIKNIFKKRETELEYRRAIACVCSVFNTLLRSGKYP